MRAFHSADPEDPAGRTVLRLRGRATKLRAGNPEYAALGVRIFAVNGAPSVTVTSSGRAGAEVARRILGEFWK